MSLSIFSFNGSLLNPFALKLALFLLPLFGGSVLLARTLDNYFQHNHTDKQLWSLSQRDQSVDYALLGSSRTFHNIDVATLEKRTGRKAINLGYDGQSLVDMYLTLHLFLAHGNKARNVVLQLDAWDLGYNHKFLNYVYLPYTSDDRVSATLNEFRPRKENLFLSVMPLAKYAEYNEFYIPTILREARSNHSMYDESGGSELLFDDSYHVPNVIEREPQLKVDDRARHYLDEIVELTKSQGIKLTIFSAPIYRDPILNNNIYEARAYIASYCQERGIPYVDLMDADFDRSEYRDISHLNGGGAERLSEMLGTSLFDGEVSRPSVNGF